eukprot:1141915-Pelagomonas_calceolata.AAC.2
MPQSGCVRGSLPRSPFTIGTQSAADCLCCLSWSHLKNSFLKHTSCAHSVHLTRSSQGSNQNRAHGVRALGIPGSSNMLRRNMAGRGGF